ncbi:NAD(P)/FAD-dependent oxidoreductase [Methyloraptor flagellatus]|uniref:FAD-dependent oxidoreductase n=1 Tax=Methyloraptor flagellatus TaxID=3162530 RepID=A0AAU7XBG6_9HYPH
MSSIDVIALGAGMVGVSAALQLTRRGRKVVLVDRREPGQETSFGNAGILEREGLVPTGFPRELSALLRYGLNLAPEANYRLRDLPGLASWLWAFRKHSTDAAAEAYAAANDALCREGIAEHRLLSAEAGADRLFRETGWIRLYRTPQGFAGTKLLLALSDRYGVKYQHLTTKELTDLEPHIAADKVFEALRFPETQSVSWPEAVTRAYADLFLKLGGRFVTGEAQSLRQTETGWAVNTAEGEIAAPEVVLALGPWSAELAAKFGYRFPLASKRGYHVHYGSEGNAVLNAPVVDCERGYVLAPMEKGIRLTTGIEIADRDAPPNYRQLNQLDQIAREMFPLAEERAPRWLGRRPAMPDHLPVLGPAPRHRGLWFDFGHGHLGFTQGPVSGRLLADMMTGAQPFLDVSALKPTRFV